MANWFRRGDGEMKPGEGDNGGVKDIEIDPSKLKEDLETTVTSKLKEYSEAQDEKLKPVLDMAKTIMEEREAKRKAADEAARQKVNEGNEVKDEDWLLDPANATARTLEPTNRAVIQLAARMTKQDVLGEKEYYHGEIKAKVDAMIAQQPLNMQARADVVENCYKLVVFDFQKDIQDGKIKAKNSSAMFEGSSTGGHSGKENGEGSETLTADEKVAARNMGISEKDWIASRKELTYV